MSFLANLLRRPPVQPKQAATPQPVVPEPRRGPRAPLPFLDPQPMPAEQVAAVQMAAALLLAYPDESYPDTLVAVRDVVGSLEGEVASDLLAYLDAAQSRTLAQAQAHYVDIFDLKRRCTLHLSYYSSGDTRRRGMALVTFGEAYQACGFEFDDDELPDHLTLVLEMAARGGGEIAEVLLSAHRQGIELLRSALHQFKTPYGHIIDAVCRTLPPIDDLAAARFSDLVASGPPQEMVGLSAPLLPFPTVRSEV